MMFPKQLNMISVIGLIFALAAYLSLGGEIFGDSSSELKCVRANTSEFIYWATSGLWLPESDRLVVADAFRTSLLEVSSFGRATGNNHEPVRASTYALAMLDGKSHSRSKVEGSEQEGGLRPSQIRMGFDSTYWVEDDQLDKLTQFDALGQVVNEVVISDREVILESGERIVLQEAYDWTALDSNRIVGFFDFQSVDSEWRCGILAVETNRARATVLHEIPLKSDTVQHLLRNRRFFTALRDGLVFALIPDQRQWIARVGADEFGQLALKKIGYAPDGLDRTPHSPEAKGFDPSSARLTYKLYEQSKMASSIYSWKERLFLLSRAPGGNRGRAWDWWLVELNVGGEAIASYHLPLSAAAHLTAAPGDTYWAWLEKRAVEDIGESGAPYMETNRLVMTPSSWLNEGIRLSREEAFRRCPL